MNTLKAERRDMKTKAKKLRREGFVTGNVFGKNMPESIPLQILEADAARLVKTCKKGSKIILDVDGQKMNVLIKEIDFEPIKSRLQEIDFQTLVSGEKVHSVAEIVILNHDKVLGGVVEQTLEEISYKALPETLVEKVEIDGSSLKAGDTIKVSDLDISRNPDIEILTSPDTVVVTVEEVHTVPDTEEAEE
ncbi:50S ribosomal protein L25/general stress protein Ctc [Drancourtella sp. An177]|nr:50S ribosomal protein L25/general stress protein Ctc [Drancourtella sp. An177]